MQYDLVPIAAENIREYVPLYVSVFNAAPWNDGWSEDSAFERLTSFAAMPKFRGLAIIEEHSPIGLVLGWGERWVKGWVFHVKEMCIAESRQRKGLGKVLMQGLEDSLLAEGFTGVYLQTGRSAPAKDFYQSLGYSEMPIVSLRKGFSK
jgi:aminoglycoside 6'-N-acetyltransferase I